MAQKTKTREIIIVDKSGSFQTLLKRFTSEKEDYDFEARLLHTIKTKSPKSIYELSKILKRDFKSVFSDLKLLQRFGFIEFISEKSGKRKRLKPILVINTLNIQIKI